MTATCRWTAMALIIVAGCGHQAMTATVAPQSGPVRVVEVTCTSGEAAADTLAIEMTLAIDPGWYVYPPGAEAAGVTPLTLAVADGTADALEGPLQGPPIAEGAPGYTGSVVLTQPLRTSGAPVVCDLRFQACSADICLPVTAVTITVAAAE